jgi:LysR family transcriptional regulator, transcription activator of glutamate synthase operon
MELRQLRYFEAVARHRHFSRAADELHVAQSALSHQVAQLEGELGVRLLDRTTRSVALTDAGQLIVARARLTLAEIDAMHNDVDALRGLVTGRLAIGALLFGGRLDIPAVIADFARQHPGIDLQLREGTAGRMAAMLRDGTLDLAFALEPPVCVPELASVPLTREELAVVTSAHHPLAARRTVGIRELAEEELIMYEHGSSTRARIEAAFLRAGITPRIVLEVNDLALTRSLVARGLGVAILPRTFADLPGQPVEVRPFRPVLSMPVVLWSRSGAHLSSAAHAFMQFAQAAANELSGPAPRDRRR